MTLFVPSKDPNMELWHGARSGVEGAVEVFGADDVSSLFEYFFERLVV